MECICKKHGLTEFVINSAGRKRCKKCRIDAVNKKRQNNKKILVEYKGGKCEICGYNKCIDALEFHHINPEEKEFGISDGNIKSIERLKCEADKCMLVCANCHKELHHMMNEKEVDFYDNFEEKLNLNEIINDINNNLSKKDMCEKYKVSMMTIVRFLKKNNIVYNEKIVKSANFNVNEIISLFKECKTFNKVANKLNISDNGLRRWCKNNGLPYKTKEMQLLTSRL